MIQCGIIRQTYNAIEVQLLNPDVAIVDPLSILLAGDTVGMGTYQPFMESRTIRSG